MKRATGCALAVLVVLAAAAWAWGTEPSVVGWRDRVIITASIPGTTPADRAVRHKLEDTTVSFTFNEQPLDEAMGFLAELGKINIVIDHGKVEAGKTVTLKLTDVSLLTAVKLSVEQVGLKWTVRDGILFVSNEDGVKNEPVTVVYDVNDLLSPPPDFEGPVVSLGNIGQRTDQNTDRGPVIGLPGPNDTPKKDFEKSREELLKEIVDLVKQMIESGTWDAGE